MAVVKERDDDEVGGILDAESFEKVALSTPNRRNN